jgi:hypothetical protein
MKIISYSLGLLASHSNFISQKKEEGLYLYSMENLAGWLG